MRRLTPTDLAALLALQKQVLPDTMSARLGRRFNEVYHETMLASADYLCDGYFVDDTLVGYLSYTTDTVRLLRGVFRRNFFKYLWAMSADVVRDPRRAVSILRIGRSIAASKAQPGINVTAELLSVGVLPALRGARREGAHPSVADALLHSALAALRARGVSSLFLVVKPVGIDPVPHRFVRKYGFSSAGSVRRFGIEAEMYVLQFGHSRPPGQRE